ncbi:MAG: hypothetical protein M1837_006468 [Sclerophora amabilis]|nr:MAG: hypothetical protein M1837_006468 [Sclerophora amabilis]
MSPSATQPSPSAGFRRIPLSYNNAESETSALRLIYALCPGWENEEGEVMFERFTDGITNTLLKATKKRPGLNEVQIDEEAVLLRAYGHNTDILIDREKEATSHALLSEHQLAPHLLARFQNGLLYRFIRGRACASSDLSREAVWRGVARKLGQWHACLPIVSTAPSVVPQENDQSLSLSTSGLKDKNSDNAVLEMMANIAPGKAQPNPWSVMQKWILALPANTQTERERKETLQRELERTSTELYKVPTLGEDGLVFSHCDLLSGNVIIEPPASGAGLPDTVETISFVDYEYATPSPAVFDIANHFAEWGGLECDYNVLPTRSQRKEFLGEYFRSYSTHLGSPGDDEEEIQRLFDQVDLFRGVPGLYWGIWALIQATISQIDFDYAKYAENRLGEYWAWRAETDGSREKAGKEKPLRERRWAEA